jgi:hypothetical protein
VRGAASGRNPADGARNFPRGTAPEPKNIHVTKRPLFVFLALSLASDHRGGVI